MSYAWTEIGIEDSECEALVKKGNITPADLKQVDKIIFLDVYPAFSVLSFLVFPCCLWILMPDWHWDDEAIDKRMSRWYQLPYWLHLLNPIRWLGYPVTLVLASKYRRMLHRAVYQVHSKIT